MTKKNRFMQGVADMALVKNKTFFYQNESIFLVQDRSILKKGNYILNRFSLSFPYNFLLTTINSTIIR